MTRRNFKTHGFNCLFLSAMILMASVSYGQSDSSKIVPGRVRPSIYVLLDCPSFAYSPDKDYLKTNFFQGGGFETEVLFKKRFGLCLDFFINNSHQDYYQGQTILNNKSLIFTPSLKLYIDSYAKLFVSIGSRLSFNDAKIEEGGSELSQRYWMNALRLGIGYKIYMFKKKRFGIELNIGSNLIIWGNPEEWTGALTNRGLYTNFSLFYKFQR